MRELNRQECHLVSGGHDPQVCTPGTALNDYYGITNTSTFGGDLINIYEGLVEAASHVIERVALAI